MKEEMNNSSESLVPMEDMIIVPAAYIEELREILKRLERAEYNCVTLFGRVTFQSPTLTQAARELSFNVMTAYNKTKKIIKEYDDHIQDMIDNYTDNEF